MLRPVKVNALLDYRLWIEYSDGVSGEIDLSDMAGKGVFKAWEEPGFFEKVRIDVDGAVIWDDCDDDDWYGFVEVSFYLLHMKITGKLCEELPLENVSGYSMIPNLLDVTPLPGYRLWVEYNNGESGEVDLSDSAGNGLFKAWKKPGFFGKAHVNASGSAVWGDDVRIYPDDLYMKLTGKSWGELVKVNDSVRYPCPVDVELRDGFRIWLRFDDGIEGELDISDLEGKGVWKALDDRAFFEGVHINERSGVVSWGCTDSCGFPDSCITELDIASAICYVGLLGLSLDEIKAIPPLNSCYDLITEAKARLGK